MSTVVSDPEPVAPAQLVTLTAHRDRLALRFPTRPAREQAASGLTAAAAPGQPGGAVARTAPADYGWALVPVVDGVAAPTAPLTVGGDAALVHVSGAIMAVARPAFAPERLTDDQRDYVAATDAAAADATWVASGRIGAAEAACGPAGRPARAGRPDAETDDGMRAKQLWSFPRNVATLTAAAVDGGAPPEPSEWRVGTYRLDGGCDPDGADVNWDVLDGRTAAVAALDAHPDALRAADGRADELYRHDSRGDALYGGVEGSPVAPGTLHDRVASRAYPRALRAGGPTTLPRSALDTHVATAGIRRSAGRGAVLRPYMLIRENGRLKTTPDAHGETHPGSGSSRLPPVVRHAGAAYLPRGSRWTATNPVGAPAEDVTSLAPATLAIAAAGRGPAPRAVPRARVGGLVSTTVGSAPLVMTAGGASGDMLHHQMRQPRTQPGSWAGAVPPDAAAAWLADGDAVPAECIVRILPVFAVAAPAARETPADAMLAVRKRVLIRCGRLGMRPLSRALRAAQLGGSLTLPVDATASAFAYVGVVLSQAEVRALRDICLVVAATVAGQADARADGVDVPRLLDIMRGAPLDERRLATAQRGYELACAAAGECPPTVRSLVAVYDPARLPDVLRGRAGGEYFRKAFTLAFADDETPLPQDASGTRYVSEAAWLDYVCDMAPGLGADEDFVAHTCGVWPQVNTLAATGSQRWG